MKDNFLFILTVLGVAGGTVAFTFNTFVTQEYLTEAVIKRLDRIESKLDTLIDSRSGGQARQLPRNYETNECASEECRKGP